MTTFSHHDALQAGAVPETLWRFLAMLVILATTSISTRADTTFCNPLNSNYGWSEKGHRHGADPVVVLFQDRYYLFSTWDVAGCRVSDDLVSWSEILFDDECQPLMGGRADGTYCAPALATDGKHVYFIGLAHSINWIITGLAGICYASPVGSRVRLTLAPHFPASLTWVKATVEIPSGVVRSDWRHDGPLDRSCSRRIGPRLSTMPRRPFEEKRSDFSVAWACSLRNRPQPSGKPI